MRTFVNTRFPVAVGVLAHVSLPAIFVINIIEMSQEYTAKEVANKLIEVLNVHQIKEYIKLGEAIGYANKYKNRNDKSNTEDPIFPFYSSIINALVTLARDILNKDYLEEEYIKKRDHEFIFDLEECKKEHSSINRDKLDAEELNDIDNMLKSTDAIYNKYVLFYTIVNSPRENVNSPRENVDPPKENVNSPNKKSKSTKKKGNTTKKKVRFSDNTKTRNGHSTEIRRTMRAKRRR